MKKLLATAVLGGILAAGFAGAIHAGDKCAEAKKACGKSAEVAQAGVSTCKAACNATVEVTNTDNGVVVKMTATTPEDVKKIQECWANRAACKAARAAGGEKAAATSESGTKCGGCPSTKAK